MSGRVGDQDNSAERVRMNDNAEIYQNSNAPTRRDAIYFLERFKNKISFKSTGDRSIDIGCADGSITNIIKSYLPSNFETFVACDMNENMIKHAKKYYQDQRTIFRLLDIEDVIPEDMIEGFDHVFSFYTFQWIQKQEQAFQNIYNLLAKGGDCLLTFLAHSPTYSIYQALAVSDKWKSQLCRLEQFLSPYHDVQDPDSIIEEIMEKIGFSEINVRCKQMIYEYSSIDAFKDKIRGINPFQQEGSEFEEFLEDCVNVARNMNMVAYSEEKLREVVKNKYNIMVVYGKKC